MTAISIHIRHKQYRRADGAMTAIRNLEFSVGEGEFVAVLGPSGCGKTTMLQAVAGLDPDFDGEIRFAGGIERAMAYVFQTPRLLPWRTVRQNIELVFDDAGAEAGRIAAILDAVGLAESADSYPGQLSLGMQRRAALARAFVLRPKLLLMDEPFVSLEETLAARLRDLLGDMLAASPATVLFVTHDWREAIRLADRLVFLTASPARVHADLKITLDEAQRRDPAAIEAFRAAHAGLFSSGEGGSIVAEEQEVRQ